MILDFESMIQLKPLYSRIDKKVLLSNAIRIVIALSETKQDGRNLYQAILYENSGFTIKIQYKCSLG